MGQWAPGNCPWTASCIWSRRWRGLCFLGGSRLPASASRSRHSFSPFGDVPGAGQRLDLRMHARRDNFVSRARLVANEAAPGPYLTWSALWRCMVSGLGVLAHFQALALALGSTHLECAGQRLPGGKASENHSSSIIISPLSRTDPVPQADAEHVQGSLRQPLGWAWWRSRESQGAAMGGHIGVDI